jgi:nitroreductase
MADMTTDANSIDHILTTTRAVRKRLDLTRPIDPAIIEDCIEIATHAPSGSNRQGWHFLVITDAALKRKVAARYKQSFDLYLAAQREQGVNTPADDPGRGQLDKVLDSAIYLSEHMGDAPALIIVCGDGRVETAGQMAQAGFYGSVLPAAWSLVIALNARGIGAAWTTLHLRYEKEVAEVLGIPEDVTQAVLLPVGYIKGGPMSKAARKPARDRTYWNGWGRKR